MQRPRVTGWVYPDEKEGIMKKTRILVGVCIFFAIILFLGGGPAAAWFQNNGDGTVTDSDTGLVWEQVEGENGSGEVTWEDGLAYCEDLERGGMADWRLPSIRELESLVDEDRYDPAVDGAFGYGSLNIWSSTTYSNSRTQAWYVGFEGGSVGYANKEGSGHYARCVRGGPTGTLPPKQFQDNGDGTVTDTETGLMWEQVRGENGSGEVSWEEGLDYCANLDHSGVTDWRLPGIRELESLVDEDRYDPAVDGVFGYGSLDTWSNTTCSTSRTQAWYVGFESGSVAYADKEGSGHYARCVRGGPTGISPPKQFQDNSDGTVTDTVTGLVWEQVRGVDGSDPLPWQAALDYCAKLEKGGVNNWRLPSIRELESLVDENRYDAAVDGVFGYGSVNTWSSTSYSNSSGQAWYVDFESGSVGYADKVASSYYARCVCEGDGLAHFEFSYISSQTVGTRFNVTITAFDANNHRLLLNGAVSLWSILGAVDPIEVVLVNGQATVPVRVKNSGKNRLTCNGYGADGNSNAFNVTGPTPCTSGIMGKVVDCKGNAVSQATVSLYDVEGNPVPEQNIASDAQGFFEFWSLQCGKYEIRVEKDGEEKVNVWKVVGNVFPSTAYDILLPLNCGTKDTPVVLVPGMMGSSSDWNLRFYVPTLPADVPEPSDLQIHLKKTTGFQILEEDLKALGFTVVECPWDWRMVCDKAFKKYLRAGIKEALKKSKTGKVHIVAHSMGGLLVRAYIQSKDPIDGYKGDIDKVAFVGTPHLGSCNPYYMWEGGDPNTVDKITNEGVKSLLNAYMETIERLWQVTYDKKGWKKKGNHDKIRSFIRDKAQSLRELMYTENFLKKEGSPWGVETTGNINAWLKELNQGSDKYNAPASVMSKDGSDGTKVEARLFVGDKEDETIRWVLTAREKGVSGATNELYEDGIPKNEKPKDSNVEWGKGDGTVPYDSATFPSEAGEEWAMLDTEMSKVKHIELVGDFVDEIKAFLDPDFQLTPTRASAEAMTAAQLYVSIRGDMRVLVTDPQTRKTGMDPDTGLPVKQIPASKCTFDAGGGGTAVENPESGKYQITYFGGAQRDFHLDIGYMDDDVTESYNFQGFRPSSTQTFTILVNPSATPRITVTLPAMAPTNLRADLYTSGATQKTRVNWSSTGEADVTGYNIYSVGDLEPYFSRVATVASETTSYDTADIWNSDASTTAMTYAVTAIKTDDTESFFSNLVQNNDRDHDSLTDEEESTGGTNPDNPDSDGDGLNDGDEASYNTNPLVQDSDGDTYNDYAEIQAGSDPLDPDSIPSLQLTVSTVVPTDISSTSATGGGSVTSDGGPEITARGICWNTTAEPTIADHSTVSGAGVGSFTCHITGLIQDTTYYARAWAANSAGTAYGENRSFKTLTTTGCSDCSGVNPIVHDVTFTAGTDCTCTGDQSLTIGPAVVIEKGARVTFKSRNIVVKSKVEAREGSVVKMSK